MKRPRKEIGYVGLGLCALGCVLALACIFAPTGTMAILLMAGMGLYVPGGLMAVAALGYQKGSKLRLAFTGMRLLFALGMILGILRIVGTPV